MRKKIKISELDNQSLFDLGLSKESLTLFVDDRGIKKENISTLNDILRKREDFFLNISSDKNESNKNNVSGNDLLSVLPDMKNLIYHTTLKYPLKNISIFAKLVNLKSLHLYGDLPKDMELKPLDNIENLESVYIENGLTLKQDVYLSMRSTIKEIGAGTFRMESFDKNPNLKKIAILSGVSHEEEIPKKLPELEEIYTNVIAKSSNNTTLYTEYLQWDNNTQKAKSPVPIRVEQEDGSWLTGSSMEGDMGLEHITIYNEVDEGDAIGVPVAEEK